ncbi:MAG: hypothetical protein JJU21_00515 [Salinarimonas sp.]|nr:hypothetical protein [Salinarimonas sp.]
MIILLVRGKSTKQRISQNFHRVNQKTVKTVTARPDVAVAAQFRGKARVFIADYLGMVPVSEAMPGAITMRASHRIPVSPQVPDSPDSGFDVGVTLS